MEECQIWLGPEVETVEAVNYFGMDMGKLAVRNFGNPQMDSTTALISHALRCPPGTFLPPAMPCLSVPPRHGPPCLLPDSAVHINLPRGARIPAATLVPDGYL